VAVAVVVEHAGLAERTVGVLDDLALERGGKVDELIERSLQRDAVLRRQLLFRVGHGGLDRKTVAGAVHLGTIPAETETRPRVGAVADADAEAMRRGVLGGDLDSDLTRRRVGLGLNIDIAEIPAALQVSVEIGNLALAV